MTKAKEDMMFEVKYSNEQDTWICPICGSENITAYIDEDLECCDNCYSEFDVFTILKVKKIGKPYRDIPLNI